MNIDFVGLSQLGIPPPALDYVVITHGHPDHAGNTNDFMVGFMCCWSFLIFKSLGFYTIPRKYGATQA
jgi:ribonuclease BN (tRNA processing enzyme)